MDFEMKMKMSLMKDKLKPPTQWDLNIRIGLFELNISFVLFEKSIYLQYYVKTNLLFNYY